MADMNIICLTGTLTREPRISQYSNNIMDFQIMSMKNSMDQNGTFYEKPFYFDIKSFQTNLIAYMYPDTKVAIQGYLQQDTWQDNNGNERSKLVIISSSIQLLGNKKDKSGSAGGRQQSENHKKTPQQNNNNNINQSVPPAQPFTYSTSRSQHEFENSDIPF